MTRIVYTIFISIFCFTYTVHGQIVINSDSTSFASIRIEDAKRPLLLKLNNGKKKLTYFGTYHTNNPNDSVFIHLQNELRQLQPDYVLFEGMENPPLFTNTDSTILISGEPGYLIQYAKKNSIKYGCIDPKDSLEYADLLLKFNKEEVVLFYLCRQIGNQQRKEEGNKVSEKEINYRMSGFLEFMRTRGMPLEGKELDFVYWKRQFKKILGFPLQWRTMDNNIHYPNQFKTILNKVSRESDAFRNKAMVETIFQTLTKADKIFILVGWGHLIIQEPTIREKWSMLK